MSHTFYFTKEEKILPECDLMGAIRPCLSENDR